MSKLAKAQKSNSDYGELLSKLADIPTLPIVAMKVNDLINDPSSSVSDITELLKKDQVLTAKILRLANSSYYSIPGGVTNVQKALAFLGFNTLAQMILGLSVFSLFTDFNDEEFTMLDFWKHALGTAICSELIGKKIKYPKPEELFTCGLLHDIGKLVLHEIDRERLYAVVKEAKKDGKSFFDIERKWDVPGHSYLGEVIASKWGLPQVIRLAIRYHHFDVSKMETILSTIKPAIHVVRLANVLTLKNEIGKSGDFSNPEVTPDMKMNVGLSQEAIEEIEKELLNQMQNAGAFLNAYR